MRIYLLYIFLLYSIFVKVSSQNNIVSITDFGPDDCDKSKNEYYTDSVQNTGIPGCYYAVGLKDRCVFDICAPGLTCNEEDLICEIDPESCGQYDFISPKPQWVKCLPDGTYAPVQCKGEALNGRCYCYNRFGKRIFGEVWSYESTNMTCACSRHRSELELQGRNDITLHCDSMGNYERLQCESGACWCADPQTGEVENSVVPESMMTILPCYDRTTVGNMYLRKCESQAYGQAKIKNEFYIHGTTYVSLSYINCDWDGSYGKLKVDGQVYCTWRDNTNIGSFADQLTNLKNINCNCARDSKMYQLAGKQFTKQCMGNGNYKKLQQYDDELLYCVDEDGFAITDPQKDLEEQNCP